MNNKTILYLVRHGQTEWNVLHKMQGHQDSPLTDYGVEQAKWLGDSLRNESIDLIYSSSSLRARRTAEIIRGELEVNIIECDEFREINLGVWEGKSQSEVRELYPMEFDNFWNDPEKFDLIGSETFNDVFIRAREKLREIITAHKGKTILIVTHTVVVKLLMAYFDNRRLKNIWKPPFIHPASLCKVVINEDDNSEIILNGDISHYKEIPTEG
ncbi:histidine phosphatase family protein [Paenibacillus polygoni]|uniref:Histidine phosphatase family protein n=1 Tax=Paenibacillus polygoni TaxID=3050112 RepID=A0ABY8X7U5_9BACL|nr:histidine phosphatase family protein [Paenibacillus polygoni]WIV21133.1 histidine phosphatase family protein [Paenibacillus polygoni]